MAQAWGTTWPTAAHDRPDDVERVHAAAEHAAHDAEHDGDRDRLLLGARAQAHEDGRRPA